MSDQLQGDLAALETATENELDKIRELRDTIDERDHPATFERDGQEYPWGTSYIDVRFRVGTKVQVRPELLKEQTVYADGTTGPKKVPWWATSGVVVANPPPGNDYHGHPYVLWDSDGKKRHVPDSWLEKAKRDRNYIRASCGCGRNIRVSDTVLKAGLIICGVCGEEFSV